MRLSLDRAEFLRLRDRGLADIRILPGVRCGHIAVWVGEQMEPGVRERTDGRCRIASVEVFEHGANSTIWRNPEDALRGLKTEALGRLVGA